MEHFDINIEHGGVKKTFHLTFDKYGWSYRFTLNVDGTEIFFEPDEERNLRAVVPPAMQNDARLKQWVALIGQELQTLLYDK